MAKPTFFIVGAPKCGTSALFEYLRTHPRVFLARIKEPNFFCSDLDSERKVRSMQEYLRLFRKCQPSRHLAIGEGSVYYLYSRAALRQLLEFQPSARLVVMLRNPVDMVHSFHSQMVYSLRESEPDFQRAWELQSDRRHGRKLPSTGRGAELLQYGEVARFGEQLERLLSFCPRENLHIILLEDLIADPRRTYEEVLGFLRLPSDGKTHFPRVNESKTHRFQRLSRWLGHCPPVLSFLSAHYKKFLGDGTPWANWVSALISRPRQQKKLSGSFRHELIDHFRDDVRKLANLLGRNLDPWTN
jgi:hypothetical protein